MSTAKAIAIMRFLYRHFRFNDWIDYYFIQVNSISQHFLLIRNRAKNSLFLLGETHSSSYIVTMQRQDDAVSDVEDNATVTTAEAATAERIPTNSGIDAAVGTTAAANAATAALTPAERRALLKKARTMDIACRNGFDSSEDVFKEYFGTNKNPIIPGGISTLCKEFKSNWYGKAGGYKKKVNGIKTATIKIVSIVLTINSEVNKGKTLQDVFRKLDSMCKPSEEDGKRHLNTLYEALVQEEILVQLGPNGEYP